MTVTDYDALIREDSVDSSIYTDEAIFAEEMARIFHRWWVYVGHESEVPEVGDYRRTFVGLQPMILARGEDKQINLLVNRCRHRGNTVCQEPRGNATFFRCQYHGWTYNNDGSLIGVPLPGGYGEGFDKSEFGLTRIRQVESYRGFIFAKLEDGGMSFERYLAPAKAMIDMFCDLSPSGEIEVRVGTQRTAFDGNWKMLGMDGYHPPFVHRSVNEALGRTQQYQGLKKGEFGNTTRDGSGNLAQDLGNGHVRINSWPSRKEQADRYVGPYQETDWGRTYLRDLERKHGKERAHELIAFQNPHTGIWPNLQVIDVHIRHIRPLSVNRTEVEMSPAMLKDVPPEVNAQRLRQHEFGYGPASFVSSDDYEVFERNQDGMQGTVNPKILLARGLDRQEPDGEGGLVSMHSDELTQRGQLQEWKRVMTLTE